MLFGRPAILLLLWPTFTNKASKFESQSMYDYLLILDSKILLKEFKMKNFTTKKFNFVKILTAILLEHREAHFLEVATSYHFSLRIVPLKCPILLLVCSNPLRAPTIISQ